MASSSAVGNSHNHTHVQYCTNERKFDNVTFLKTLHILHSHCPAYFSLKAPRQKTHLNRESQA